MLSFNVDNIPEELKRRDQWICWELVERNGKTIAGLAENLIIAVMRTVYYHESDDFAFAADIANYLDNKQVVEAIQALNRQWGVEEPTIVGEI